MNKFVFVESISKKYIEIKNNVKKNRRLINQLKLVTISMILVSVILSYLFFVNISSTKWYFLRQEMGILEEEKFSHSLVQLEVLRAQKKVWQDIQDNSWFKQNNVWKQPQWLTVNDRIIYINTEVKLTSNN